MNKSRRARIDKILEKLEEINEELSSIQEEENDAYNNLPFSIQESERGEKMYESVYNLDAALGTIEEITDYLTEAKGED